MMGATRRWEVAMNRRELLANSALILIAMALPMRAAGQERYEPQSFEAALASGPVVVHVYADWCPVCRAQKPVLATLAKEQALVGVKFVAVDFDTEKQFLRTHRVANQSVILVFKNGQEAARLIGITDADKIRAGLLGAL
jgi:thiol-disulfide isomerase/thioredoxin